MTSPCTDLDAGKVARPGLDQSSSEATLDTRMGKCTEGGARSQDNPTLRNFIEQLLLPKLSSINRLMTLEIHSVTAALDTGFPYLAYNYAVDGSYRIGKGNASEDHTTFSMNQQEDNLWDDSWYQEARDYFKDIRRSPGQGATVWRYHKIESGDDAGHRFCKKTAHMQIWMYGDSKCLCRGAWRAELSGVANTFILPLAITITRLYMLAGSNEIVYEGAQWTKFELWIEPGVLLTKENGK